MKCVASSLLVASEVAAPWQDFSTFTFADLLWLPLGSWRLSMRDVDERRHRGFSRYRFRFAENAQVTPLIPPLGF